MVMPQRKGGKLKSFQPTAILCLHCLIWFTVYMSAFYISTVLHSPWQLKFQDDEQCYHISSTMLASQHIYLESVSSKAFNHIHTHF